MRRLALAVPVLVVAIALAGCRIVGSADIATSSIDPRIYVESDPSGSTLVWVALLHAFGDALQLSSGDVMTVSDNGGTPVSMTFTSDLFLTPAYVATLSGVAAGDQLTLALNRASHADAPATLITIPAAFSIDSPTDGTHYAFGDAIHVAWTPGSSSDRVAVRIEIESCTQATATEIADANSLVDYPRLVPASDGSMDVDLPIRSDAGTCQVRVVAGRDPGSVQLDPAFGYLSTQSAAVRIAPPVTVQFGP